MSQKKFRLLFRIGYINAILYIIILSCALSANSQLSNIVEKGRRIIELNEDTSKVGEINLRIDDNENETNDDEEDDTNKFSWKTHQDDHSIYAHRSLMSTANIERPNLEKNTEDEEQAEPAGLAKPGDPDDELASLKTIDFAEKEWQLMFRSFDLMFDGVSSSLIQEIGHRTNLLNEVISRLKPECRRDIDHMRRSVKQHKLWALKMVDSIGKLPSGITYGKFSSPGDYEECLSVRINEQVYTPRTASSASSTSSSAAAAHRDKQESSRFSIEQHKFHGKYCLIDFRLPLPERPKDKLLSIHDPVIDLAKTEVGKQFPDLQNYSGYASVFYEVGYMHAVCLPSTCDVHDLTRSIGKALEGLHIIVNNTVDCEERPDEMPAWRTSQVIATTLLVILFANATCASTMRYFSQNQKREELRSRKTTNSRGEVASRQGWLGWVTNVSAKNRVYSECFSVQSNFERLSKPDPRGLTFVHYTRIVAMALTVITHTAGLGTLQAITKPADASNSEQIFRDFIPQMLANAFTSIQIFFFMAGFMLVISTYPSINREKGHMSFLEYAIKRAIRLMPGLAATICINFIWPLLVDGPMLSYFVRLIVVPCETNWWRTMAFLSNFDHVEKMCLRHSYFSASDYQLHILAFPLLILLYKQPNLSLIIAGLLTCAGFVVQVIMILTKTVLPFMMVDYIDKQAFFNVVHYIHHPSWNHMSAFFYGFIIGYLVVKQIRINLSETTIKRLWYTILPLGFASIFAPYFWNHYKRPIYRWQMVLYVLFDRFALLTACAWLSYATMVLGRKPASPNKQAASGGGKPTTTTGKADNQGDENKLGTAKGLTNLPSTVQALAGSAQFEKTDNIADVSADRAASEQQQRPTPAPLDSGWSLMPPKTNGLSVSSLSLNNSTNALTRQRSSPNFQVYVQRQGDNQSAPSTLRPAISSSNVHSEAAARDHARQSQAAVAALSTAAAAAVVGAMPDSRSEQRPPKKPQAVVSNVNTLCLILSRLTFQLYLFNMVVLWIDVNHSKYYWFFSYYFIITKALAIYICSSLLALVFFVTLESPSLTLYIIWVKSRAQARAERGTQAANNKDEAAGDGNGDGRGGIQQEASSGRTLQESPKFEAREAGGSKLQASPFQLYGFAAGSPSSQRDHINHHADQFGGSSDCLSIKMGSPVTIAVAEPTSFSYIDLSSQTQSTDKQDKRPAAPSLGTFTGSSDTLQTKM